MLSHFWDTFWEQLIRFRHSRLIIINQMNKQAKTTHKYIHAKDSIATANPMLHMYRESIKQPLRPFSGLPAPQELSSAGKLNRY